MFAYREERPSVLIVDPDPVHAEELQGILLSAGYGVVVCPDERDAFEMMREDGSDLVIVVPRSPVTLPDALASARRATGYLERCPEFLFVLRWTPQGPAERLMGDRWNVQVLYER